LIQRARDASAQRAPTDVLIRAILDRARLPGEDDIALIRRALGDAGFSSRSDSLGQHLARRVAEGQWRNTTAVEYLEDLRAVFRVGQAGLAIYRRRGGALLLAFTSTARVVPPERLGPNTLPLLAVVYSADRGVIISGYQASALDRVHIPPDAIWLTSPPPS
jgi:hypothetical protein